MVNKVGLPAFTEGDQSLLTAPAGQVAVAIESANLYEDVRDLSVAAIRSRATAIDARDPYTRAHSEGGTRLAVKLGRELGWSAADLEMLEFAALLHDVGKIAVPDAILHKVELLTPDKSTRFFLHLSGIMGAREKGVWVTTLAPDKPGKLADLTHAIVGLGGYIVALGIFLGEDPSNQLVTFKVSGVAQSDLREVIAPLIEKVIDIRSNH